MKSEIRNPKSEIAARRWAKHLVVTVSVEPDDPAVVGTLGAYRSLDGLVGFHALCRRYGVRPTYLLTYSAACEPRCVEFARACGNEAEFGAHLHPEEVPPISDAERGNTTLRPSQVEPTRLREKLANLMERVGEAVGRKPTSYRAGFFDLTPAQVAALGELGIEADSSLGPLERVGRSHPFLHVPFAPHLIGVDSRFQIPDSTLKSEIRNPKSEMVPLVEVPLTSLFRRAFPRALFGVYFRLPGPARGALRALGLAEVLRFRPAAASARDLIAVCRRTERMGTPAVMTTHSNELCPGTSTSVPTPAACEGYFARLEQVFAFARERGWASFTLTEVARKARGEAE